MKFVVQVDIPKDVFLSEYCVVKPLSNIPIMFRVFLHHIHIYI